MKHARNPSRRPSSVLVSALTSALAVAAAPVALAASLAVPTSASAADVENADCQVRTVLATKDGDRGVPKELEFLKVQLSGDQFAAYKSFYLVEQKGFPIKLNKDTQVKFRSGHRLGLSLLGGDDKRLKLHASLTGRDGAKPLLSTDYSIENKGALMVGAGAFEFEPKKGDKKKGKLFFAIQCASSS